MKKVTIFQMVMALFLCMSLAVPPGLIAQGEKPEAASDEEPALRPEEIDALMAPIALYPDDLLAQVLAASTYPLEIVQAARFMEQNKQLKDEKLMAAAKDKDWDPSVKGLLQFPEVLAMMNEKIDWTEKLGDAFLSQQKDVMASAQRLRQKAQESGNLKTTKEQKVVVQQETKTIIIEPANPEVVYVPTYNPTVVYGAWPYPAYPPYYYYPPGYVAGAALFSFGVGVAVGAAWGAWGGWGCGWGHNEVNINTNRQNNFTQNNYTNAQKYQKNQNVKNQNWQHNPEHRKGVEYRDKGTAQKYGQQRQGSGGRASTADARGYGQGAGDRGGGRAQTSDLGRGGQGAGDRGGGRPQTSDLGRGGQGAGDRGGGSDFGRGGDRQGAGDRGGGSGGRAQTSDLSRGGGRESAMDGAGRGGSERASSYRGQESRSSASRSSGGFSGGRGGASRSGGGGGGGASRSGGGGGGGGRSGGGGGGGGRR